jgi:O-methyltransferase
MRIQFPDKLVEYKDIQDPVFEKILATSAANCMWTGFQSIEPMYCMYKNLEYIVENQIAGDIVECGVWRGGMMQLAALTLKHLGDESRQLYLYDTFTGMPEPGDRDVNWNGELAREAWKAAKNSGQQWGGGGSVDQIREVMISTGYPKEKMTFVPGMVEDTIPDTIMADIAILRLDTDFYRSTLHELVHLYPRLVIGGVLVVDDYGYYKGAREATDEYIQQNRLKLLLTRVNMSVHQAVKIEA